MTPEAPFRELAVGESWVEALIGSEWMAAYRLVAQEGLPVIAEFRLFPAEDHRHRPKGHWSAEVLGARAKVPPGGITARLVRQARVGEHQRFAGEFLRYVYQRLGEGPFAPGAPLERRRFHPPTKGKAGVSSRRSRKPDFFYVRIASTYAAEVEKGSRSPIVDTAKRLHINEPSRVRDWIHEARQRGLLSSAQWGKRGGELTHRGWEILGGVKAGQKRKRRRPAR